MTLIDSKLQALDTILETLPSGMILCRPDGEIIKLNQRAKDVLNLTPDAVAGNLSDLPGYLSNMSRLLMHHEENIHRGELKLPLPKRLEAEGEESTIGFSLKKIPMDDGSFVKALTFNDITQVLRDRLAMEKIKDELNQSKKLASIGTMISGVAHEMNNPLTGISMSAQMARMSLDKLKKKLDPFDPKSQAEIVQSIEKTLDEIGKIAKNTEKASVLVGDLLSYSKPTQLNLETGHLRHLVNETMQALKSHPQFSQFTFETPDDERDWIVQYDRVKLEQVFYNLFKNACDATEGKGKVSIRFTESDSSGLDNSGQIRGGKNITVKVRDNGPGIDKTVLTRIFDPFFSTKGNKGVGLGLSISYRTVEAHGGMLSVDSEPGEWTEFRVMLPVYDGEDKATENPANTL